MRLPPLIYLATMDKLKITYENQNNRTYGARKLTAHNEAVWKEGVFEVASLVYEAEHAVFTGLTPR